MFLTNLEKIAIIDVVKNQIEKMGNKDDDRYFDLPPKSEWIVYTDDSVKGLKGFIHKILYHQTGKDPDYYSLYHQFLSYDQYNNMVHKLSVEEDKIWWVDNEDWFFDGHDYTELNQFLEDLYTQSINFFYDSFTTPGKYGSGYRNISKYDVE